MLDVGTAKQLFLDERLCAASDGVRLVMNPARRTGDVLIELDQAYETAVDGAGVGSYSSVMEEDGKLRIWWFYSIPGRTSMEKRRVCYAESVDGIHFTKPELGLLEMGGSKACSAVIGDPVQGACVWIDPNAASDERYRSQAKLGPFPETDTTMVFYASPDGIRWNETHRIQVGACDTQNVVFWDEMYRRYVMYTREWARTDDPHLNYRQVRRLESDDLRRWENESIVWEADEIDLAYHATSTGQAPVDYYGACVYRYPDAGNLYVLLAEAFWHWKDRPDEEKWGYSPDPKNLQKRVVRLAPSSMDVRLGYSRDGKEFSRTTDRGPFLRMGQNGCFDSRRVWILPRPIHRGDEIWFYYVGDNRDHDGFVDPAASARRSGISRAVLRLDGFVSADADHSGGWVETPAMKFTGNRLVVNLDASGGGSARVELRNEKGEPIPGYSAADSIVLLGNGTSLPVSWKGGAHSGALEGKPIKIRFLLQECKLYAFQFTRA